MSITLTFSAITGTDLINQDRFSLSDPYIRVTTADGAQLVQTPSIRNEVDAAEWAGPFEASVEALGELKVAIIDRDRGADDPMGHAFITIPAENGTHTLSDLRLTGIAGVEESHLSLMVGVAGLPPPPQESVAKVEPIDPSPTPEPPAPAAPAPPGNWWEAALPSAPAVRKEVRRMSADEQRRVKAAYMKLRENKVDAAGSSIKGSSEWCRLAGYHGGFPGTDLTAYCSHGRENFPNWHRPYLIDFEQMLRRADMALGGDGELGLPYWGWEELEVNGEVLPAIIREMCAEIDNETWAKMQEGDPSALDFYPGSWDNRDGHYWLSYRTKKGTDGFQPIPDDKALARLLTSAKVVEQAERSLHMSMHRAHASSTYARGRANVSIEQPHGTVHVYTGDVMKSHRSSFHPVFWMHHCNIDRFYQAYLEEEGYTNCKREFRRNQARRPARPDPGYPDGPWGRLEPFHSNGGVPGATSEATMADTQTMGYVYDSLPAKTTGRQMREAPYYAVFEQIRVATLERPCAVFVYVYDKEQGWTPPEAACDEDLIDAVGFAGSGSIFFFALADKPCENCVGREPYDLRVEVTDALRKANLHPKRAALGVMVTDDGGKALPIEQTKVPRPTLRGPAFFTMGEMLGEGGGGGGGETAEVEALQRLLVAHKLKQTDVVDGELGEKTIGAIKAFQRASGIAEDGVFGPVSKRRMTVGNMTNDILGGGDKSPVGLKAKRGATVGWWLDGESVPSDLPIEGVEAELTKAFSVWEQPSGLRFAQKAQKSDATITIDFDDRTAKNDFLFDGPGGALAEASSTGITFDEEERWCLASGGHKQRAPFTWDDQEFELLTVAIHEIGHLLGLPHSEHVADAMSPYYLAGRTTLSANDIVKCQESRASAGGGGAGGVAGLAKEGKKGGGGSSACEIL